MLKRLSGISILILCLAVVFSAQVPRTNLEHLRTWAGKYPTDGEGKRAVDILKLPEIRQPLIKLLGTKKYQKAMDDYNMEVPIDLIEQNLIVQRWNKFSEEKIVVVINLIHDTKDISIGFIDGDDVEWFSTNGSRKKPLISSIWCEIPDSH